MFDTLFLSCSVILHSGEVTSKACDVTKWQNRPQGPWTYHCYNYYSFIIYLIYFDLWLYDIWIRCHLYGKMAMMTHLIGRYFHTQTHTHTLKVKRNSEWKLGLNRVTNIRGRKRVFFVFFFSQIFHEEIQERRGEERREEEGNGVRK